MKISHNSLLRAGALAVALLWAAPGFAARLDADDPARSTAYRNGQRALASEQWNEALQIFRSLADERGTEADAALYWTAWTEWKLARKPAALGTLRTLFDSYPGSGWTDDARALELEIGGRAGGPDTEDASDRALRLAIDERENSAGDEAMTPDEELKLYALDGLMQAEPERAVPILEKFLSGNHSLRLKERALFVLGQSDTPRSRQIMVDLARRGTPPAIRLKAVESLGIAGEKDDLAALASIWKEATPEVKLKVLEAWMIAGVSEPVVEVARTEKDPELRRKAIEMLGVMDATEALGQLYAAETDVAIRGRLLEAYGIAGDVGALARAARGESDKRLRAKAIEGLGVFGGKEGSRQLVELYGVEREIDLRRRIAESLMVNGDAAALVSLFKKETDRELKKSLLQNLSLLDDDAVDGLLAEVLEEKP